MKYSKYQEDIFAFIESGTGHGIVEAVAGSGKTTTIVEAANRIPRDKSAIFVAFNKHIAEALQDKLPPHVEARTLHSIGWQICRENITGYVRVNGNKIKNALKFDVFNWRSCSPKRKKKFYAMSRPIAQLVSLAKSQGWSADVDQATMEEIVARHGIELPEVWDWGTFKATMLEGFGNTKVMDYDDMIWYPLIAKLEFPTYDYVFVDESQDLSPAQAQFVMKLSGDRIIAVGDTHQAIYGFRGADAKAMQNLKTTLIATVLPLSICYRCGKNIVAAAQKIVPHIEACEGASDGIVTSIPYDKFSGVVTDDAYVLCRVTAPLVEACLDLIAEGRKATVLGRDIGEMLLTTLKGLQLVNSVDIQTFKETLEGWYESRVKKMCKEAIVKITDTRDTLLVLARGCSVIGDVKTRISNIFSKDGEGIIFSTIHKSKGLEADTIFILRPDLLPHPLCTQPWQLEQEDNLHYVAITRAKKKLIYVKESS